MHIRNGKPHDARLLAQLIAEANRDVALRFGLTVDNCPKHPSFCTEAWIQADWQRDVRYFILEREGVPIGCVALEDPQTGGGAYLNRLAVLPDSRSQGAGAMLVRHVLAQAGAAGLKTLSIGIIAALTELKQWYEGLGFRETETRSFPHLPFAVSYMACEIGREG